MSKEKRVNPLLVFLLILVPILLIVIVLLLAALFKVSSNYNALIEEQKVKEENAIDYQNAYNNLVSGMLSDGASLEQNGNLIVSVWNNAIWQKQSDDTDKYTMKNGEFVSDFNDALGNLFEDEVFSSNMEILSSNQQQIRADMKTMTNPPEGYEDAYDSLKELYDSYLAFSNTILNVNGSLESFSKDFHDADDTFISKYNNAELYVK